MLVLVVEGNVKSMGPTLGLLPGGAREGRAEVIRKVSMNSQGTPKSPRSPNSSYMGILVL